MQIRYRTFQKSNLLFQFFLEMVGIGSLSDRSQEGGCCPGAEGAGRGSG